jgi:hypothetical protein
MSMVVQGECTNPKGELMIGRPVLFRTSGKEPRRVAFQHPNLSVIKSEEARRKIWSIPPGAAAFFEEYYNFRHT